MALRIITHCYSYLRNITHIEEDMSNSSYYSIWLILRTIYIYFTGTAAGTSNGRPTAAYQGSSRGATIHWFHSHFWASRRRRLRCSTKNTIYRISLLIITHHYSSLCNSLLIITHHYSNSITHHYAPLHYLGWVKNLLRCLKVACTKLSILSHYTWKSTGGGWPPTWFLCVMMSKKEIYE